MAGYQLCREALKLLDSKTDPSPKLHKQGSSQKKIQLVRACFCFFVVILCHLKQAPGDAEAYEGSERRVHTKHDAGGGFRLSEPSPKVSAPAC